MNYTNKLTIITSLIFVAIIAVAAFSFASQAMAWAGGTDDGQGGCCGPDQSLVSGGSNDNTPPPSLIESNPDPDPAAKCISFSADRTKVPHNGGTVNLSWSTKNASSVSISGVGSGLAANKSNHSVTVNSNTTFTLTAIGAGGNDSHCKVTITLENPPAETPKCLSFTANKNVVNKPGETVVLTWNTQNANSVSINQGIGNVTPVNNGSYSVFVSNDTTFTLTVKGAGGETSCTVSITTKTTHVPTPSCNYLRADTDNFEEFGDRITLSWSTTNADEVTITRLGRVSSSGSENVTIHDERTTFNLTARNLQYNTEATCTVTVRVDEEEDDEPKPKCELEVSKTRVNKGDRVTLSWETSNADEIRIRDDRGNTIFDTKNYSSSQRKRYLDGEIDVVINRSTEFTLNAYGDGGNRTCRVEVKTDDLAVYENRDQGYVIALTQVPYTGFEAGPFLTFLFYAVLTLWALFIAYVLVIKKSSILGFSLYGNTGASAANEADIANRKKVEALVAKYSGLNQN